MAKIILQHNRPECIGCSSCAAIAPDFWVMADDNKADIKDSKLLSNGWEEKEVDEKDLQINKDAAESCPVNVIHILDKDGKKII